MTHGQYACGVTCAQVPRVAGHPQVVLPGIAADDWFVLFAWAWIMGGDRQRGSLHRSVPGRRRSQIPAIATPVLHHDSRFVMLRELDSRVLAYVALSAAVKPRAMRELQQRGRRDVSCLVVAVIRAMKLVTLSMFAGHVS